MILKGYRKHIKATDGLHKEAISGNVQACREFLDRVEGKVTDKVSNEVRLKTGIPKEIEDMMTIKIYGIKAGDGPPEEQQKRLEESGEYIEV